MSERRLTARVLERTLRESGLSCKQAKAAMFFMRQAGFMTVLLAQAKPPKRGIFTKLKNALSGK